MEWNGNLLSEPGRAALQASGPPCPLLHNDGVWDVRALALKVLGEVGDENRDEFLSELSSAITKPEIPSEIEDVRIMSLHKSKGLSSPVTFVCGCVQGLLPRRPDPEMTEVERRADLEEQRRLFYVGITRVKASPDQGKTEPS